MAQLQYVAECSIVHDAVRRKDYYTGKLGCDCPFKKAVTPGSKPPQRLLCDHHAATVKPGETPPPPVPYPSLEGLAMPHPHIRSEAEASCRLDADTIMVPPLSVNEPVTLCDTDPSVIAVEALPVEVAVVAAPQQSESVTASAPTDPSRYDEHGRLIIDQAAINRAINRMFGPKK